MWWSGRFWEIIECYFFSNFIKIAYTVLK